jgi:hypothetical protein
MRDAALGRGRGGEGWEGGGGRRRGGMRRKVRGWEIERLDDHCASRIAMR